MSSDLPGEIDTSKPSVARIYDACLGGKDNYEVDRAVRRSILDVAPDMMLTTQDNREWLVRLTRYLTQRVGIAQFLDLGSGLPTMENTHEVAQRYNSEARVVYGDNDPIVQAHGRALLAENNTTRFTAVDLTKPDEVLNSPEINQFLDFSEPIALYQIGTLHHHPDTVQLREVMRTYVDALAPGSYVAISHFCNPGGEAGNIAEKIERSMVDGPMGSGHFRTAEEIEGFFPAPLEIVEPGLVATPDWWPDGPRSEALTTVQGLLVAGVARKP